MTWVVILEHAIHTITCTTYGLGTRTFDKAVTLRAPDKFIDPDWSVDASRGNKRGRRLYMAHQPLDLEMSASNEGLTLLGSITIRATTWACWTRQKRS